MSLKLETSYADAFLVNDAYQRISKRVKSVCSVLSEGTGRGADFTGWYTLPDTYDRDEFARIKTAAKRIREDSDLLIVIGIGGSYLGARAAIEFLKSSNYNLFHTPQIFFIGNSISPDALFETLSLCDGKRVSLNVVSKSGTTTEPAIAFRVFREFMEKKYGAEGASKRIYCTTDRSRGAMKKLADEKGYETFVIPDNIGGRYSVLTAVGLLPIAVSGADLDALMDGAQTAMHTYTSGDLFENDCCRYAALRNLLYESGKTTEILASFDPSFSMMCEWWKQLYGESEGKDKKGIFPASVIFSTDLHSMGQYIQDGRRILFETMVFIEKPRHDLVIGNDPQNMDGLNFLSGQIMSEVNEKSFMGTALAHNDGGVPVCILKLPDFSENTLGELVYFFEKACAISGYLLDVNPFDQPGVEMYKKNMFALLGKPGYEDEKKTLEKRLVK